MLSRIDRLQAILRFLSFGICTLVWLLGGALSSSASVRGEAPTVMGDARQVGLAGASLAMPDSIYSAMDNPANASFEKWAISLAASSNKVRDSRMNSDGEFRRGKGRGILASSPKFGFFLGQRIPSEETDGITRIEVQETHVGAAYRFSNHLSIGLSVLTARSDWISTIPSHASAWNLNLGTTYIHNKVRYALAFRPSIPITDSTQPDSTRVVEIPWRLSFGASYALLPDLLLHGAMVTFGGQKGARQLSYPYARAANSASFQPRFGVEYRMVEKNPWALSFFAGSYFEPGRMEGYNARVHTTGGTSLGFLSGRASVSIDRAPEYKNIQAYLGIDILDALVRLKAFSFLDQFKEENEKMSPNAMLTPANDAVPLPSKKY